jgi:hypothetical protein
MDNLTDKDIAFPAWKPEGFITFENFCRSRQLPLNYISVLKYKLFDMGSDGDFDRRKKELQQITGKEMSVDDVWWSYISEADPSNIINKYNESYKEYIGITLTYIKLGTYLFKYGNALFTHSNVICNQNNGKIGKLFSGISDDRNIDDIIKDVDHIKNSEIREYCKYRNNGYIPTYTDYSDWYENRPGGILLASGCETGRTDQYKQACQKKYGKHLFHWGYCRYVGDNLMPMAIPSEYVNILHKMGIRYMFTGHTPQIDPVCIIRCEGRAQDILIHFIGADTSVNRGNGKTAVIYDEKNSTGDIVHIYAQLKDDINSIHVSYNLSDKYIGNFGELKNIEEIPQIKLLLKDKKIKDNNQNLDGNIESEYLIIGMHENKYIITFRGEDFFMKNAVVELNTEQLKKLIV